MKGQGSMERVKVAWRGGPRAEKHQIGDPQWGTRPQFYIEYVEEWEHT